jgi:hypothetical protein
MIEPLLSPDLSAWRQALAAEGFAVRGVDDVGLIYVRRTKYLPELIPAGSTLDAQIQVLTKWATESLGVLARHDPGIQPPPKPARRKRSQPQQSTDRKAA